MQAAKEKISVVLPNHLGDVVMATPALRALRRGRPEAEITAVVQEILAPILGGCPWIDRVWTHRIYSAGGQLARLRRRWAVGKQLKGTDCVIVLPNSFSSALLAAASGAPCRVGYRRNGRGWLLSDPPRRRVLIFGIAPPAAFLSLRHRLGGEDHYHAPALCSDRYLHVRAIGEVLDEPLHDFPSQLLVRQFPAPEDHGALHLVTRRQELARVPHLEGVVVRLYLGPHLHFLHLRDMLVLLGLLGALA